MAESTPSAASDAVPPSSSPAGPRSSPPSSSPWAAPTIRLISSHPIAAPSSDDKSRNFSPSGQPRPQIQFLSKRDLKDEDRDGRPVQRRENREREREREGGERERDRDREREREMARERERDRERERERELRERERARDQETREQGRSKERDREPTREAVRDRSRSSLGMPAPLPVALDYRGGERRSAEKRGQEYRDRERDSRERERERDRDRDRDRERDRDRDRERDRDRDRDRDYDRGRSSVPFPPIPPYPPAYYRMPPPPPGYPPHPHYSSFSHFYPPPPAHGGSHAFAAGDSRDDERRSDKGHQAHQSPKEQENTTNAPMELSSASKSARHEIDVSKASAASSTLPSPVPAVDILAPAAFVKPAYFASLSSIEQKLLESNWDLRQTSLALRASRVLCVQAAVDARLAEVEAERGLAALQRIEKKENMLMGIAQ